MVKLLISGSDLNKYLNGKTCMAVLTSVRGPYSYTEITVNPEEIEKVDKDYVYIKGRQPITTTVVDSELNVVDSIKEKAKTPRTRKTKTEKTK